MTGRLPSVAIVRRIKATPARVWAAITQPELMLRWWGPDAGPTLDVVADVRPGGRFSVVFRLMNGEEHNPTPDRPQGFRRVLGDGDGIEQADYQSADEAIRLLREQKDKPFFLAVGFIRPHVPDIAPRKYFERHALEKIALPKMPAGDRDDIPPAAFMDPKVYWNMSEADGRESIRAYYACVAFMDAQAGRVLDELEKLGLADNTIVTFVGDHGYALGEHATWQKMMLFEPVARVPYIIVPPKSAGVKPASTKALVELIDLYPTIAQLANLTPPKEIDGVSLVPVLKDPAAKVKDAAYTQVRRKSVNGRTVRTDRWRYTEWGPDGAAGVELYDEQNDPGELTNLANDSAQGGTVAVLKKMMRE